MANFVRNIATLCKLLLAVVSLLAFQSSNAQCVAFTANGINWVPLNGGAPYPGNNHCYYISTSGGDNNDGRFRGSQIAGAVAGIANGYAATLHDANENAFLANAILAYNGGMKATGEDWGSPRNAWIGFTDIAGETQFMWSSGEPICYTNWNTGEPNDFAIGEDYTQMLIMENYGSVQPFGKWNDWYNDNIPAGLPGAGPTRLPIILEIGNRVTSCDSRGNEGCSHGYWKSASKKWWTGNVGVGAAQYKRGDNFFTRFDISPVPGGWNPNLTFDGALNLGGGGLYNVARQGVAALLNAADPDVDFPYTEAEILEAVEDAFEGQIITLPDPATNYTTNKVYNVNTLGAELDRVNNLGCPINAHGNPINGSTSRRGPSGEETATVLEKQFSASGYPNPSRGNFSIQLEGATTENVGIRVTDVSGRLIEHRTNLAPNQIIAVGATYKAGLYYVEVSQGSNKQHLKMIKQ